MRELSLEGYAGSRRLHADGLSRWVAVELVSGATSRQVILRHLLPDLGNQDSMRGRWLQAGEQNAQLDHPCVRKVVDWGVWDASTCIAQEHIAGTSLAKLLSAARSQKERLSAGLAVHVGRSLLSGLAYVEAQAPGLRHLDVRPERVHVDEEGSVLLGEFGLWSMLEPAEITRRRFDAGEVHYLAPEVVQSLPNDVRSDLFSVGSILFEMLSAQRAFGGATSLAAAMEIGAGRRRNVRDCTGESDALCEVVERLLAHRPEGRYQSVHEALEALSVFESLQNEGRLELSARVTGRTFSSVPEVPAHSASSVPAKMDRGGRMVMGQGLGERTAFEVPRHGAQGVVRTSRLPALIEHPPGAAQSAAPSTTPYLQVPAFSSFRAAEPAAPQTPTCDSPPRVPATSGRSLSVAPPPMFVGPPSAEAPADAYGAPGSVADRGPNAPWSAQAPSSHVSAAAGSDGELPTLVPPPMHVGAKRPAAVAAAFPNFDRFDSADGARELSGSAGPFAASHSPELGGEPSGRRRRGAAGFDPLRDGASLAALRAGQPSKPPLEHQTGPVFAPPADAGWGSKAGEGRFGGARHDAHRADGLVVGASQGAAESSAREGRRLMPSLTAGERDLVPAIRYGGRGLDGALGFAARASNSSPHFALSDPGHAARADSERAQPAQPAYEPYVPAHRSRGKNWLEPSHTVFLAKNYASGKTGTAQNRMPLLAVVLLSMVFGSSAMGLLYLLYRMLR